MRKHKNKLKKKYLMQLLEIKQVLQQEKVLEKDLEVAI